MKVVLHVGMHKTATTFLQAEIFPKIPEVNLIHKFELGTKMLDEKINIISNEGFSGKTYHPYIDAEERYIKADRLKAMFPDAYILVGIREPASWKKSLYSQYLKRGGVLKFADWKKAVDPDYFHVEYYIGHLKVLFGIDKVYVYSFEELKKDHHKFVLGICGFLGVDMPNYKNKVFQKGFTPRQAETMRIINKIMHSKQNPKGIIPFEPFRRLIDMVRKTDNPKRLREI